MYNLKLNDTKGEIHDLEFKDGQLIFISGDDYIPQKVKQTLLSVQGDWFRDVSEGVPYYEEIFVKNPNFSRIRAIFSREIRKNKELQELGVKKIEFNEFQLNNGSRKLSFSFRIILESGESIEGTEVIPV